MNPHTKPVGDHMRRLDIADLIADIAVKLSTEHLQRDHLLSLIGNLKRNAERLMDIVPALPTCECKPSETRD